MIILCWATIRPEEFKEKHNVWIERAVNKEFVCTLLVLNTDEDIKRLTNEDNICNVLVLGTNKRKGVCYPCSELMKQFNNNPHLILDDDDIIVFASDDMAPPKHWDELIYNSFCKFGGTDFRHGCLEINDGYQLSDYSNMEYPCISLPIMTFATLKALNYTIYSDNYNHLFSDCELYMNLKEMDLLIDARNITFEHKHWSNKKRNIDENDKQYYSFMEEDRNTWLKRKELSLEERLKNNT